VFGAYANALGWLYFGGHPTLPLIEAVAASAAWLGAGALLVVSSLRYARNPPSRRSTSLEP
jgi:hypothetical protein